MTIRTLGLGLLAIGALSACNIQDKTRDGQIIGRGPLQNLQAGVWVDPRGCQHWIVDDGVEGYLSTRYNPRTGLPVCNRADAPPEYATGGFRGGQDINDPL